MDIVRAKTGLHRDGERELPTEPGYYWFRGLYSEGGGMSGNLDEAMLRVSFPGGLGFVNHGSDGWYLAQFEGQFWGPITPPWIAKEGTNGNRHA
jgi:hypothetical protein